MNGDVLIIGSGAAGLTAALELAQQCKVIVLAKGAISDGATSWAQGGIAAVLETTDTFESHVEDTMVAGAGLNNRAIVEHVVAQAPEAIERLADLGVPFDLGADKHWHLTREGGHSHRRIVHVNDATGLAVQQAPATPQSLLSTSTVKHMPVNLPTVRVKPLPSCTSQLVSSEVGAWMAVAPPAPVAEQAGNETMALSCRQQFSIVTVVLAALLASSV